MSVGDCGGASGVNGARGGLGWPAASATIVGICDGRIAGSPINVFAFGDAVARGGGGAVSSRSVDCDGSSSHAAVAGSSGGGCATGRVAVCGGAGGCGRGGENVGGTDGAWTRPGTGGAVGAIGTPVGDVRAVFVRGGVSAGGSFCAGTPAGGVARELGTVGTPAGGVRGRGGISTPGAVVGDFGTGIGVGVGVGV
jgi:hypothetical protein